MPPSQGNDTRALIELIASTLALLNQFAISLNPSTTSTSDTLERLKDPPDPLHVLRDSAKLVKAHTTKLSLLAINKPFSPTAITKVLKELGGTCLPAMMSAVQICEQENAAWGSMMGKEMQARSRRVFKELETLLDEIRSIAEGNEAGAKRDSLSSTGVVWESCDACIELDSIGVVGLAVQKAQQYRDTIKDAIQELKEWTEGDDLEHEGQTDKLLDSDDEGVDGDRASIDDIFNAANSMPKDQPELKALAEETDDKLKKVVILYAAIIKRRIKTFKAQSSSESSSTSAISRLDEAMSHLKRVPYQADELAMHFYDLDQEGVKVMLQKCLDEARAASTAIENDWLGQPDEFTLWLQKWSDAVG